MQNYGYETGRLDLPFVGLFTFEKSPICLDFDKIDTDVAILCAPSDMGSYNLLDANQAEKLLGVRIQGQLAIRPESIHVAEPGRSYGAHLGTSCQATVRHHHLLGNVIRYHVDAQGCNLMVDLLNRSSESLLPAGAQIDLLFNREELQEVA